MTTGISSNIGGKHSSASLQKEIYCENRLTTALNSVDFPTLGRPTMPARKLMLILATEKRLLMSTTGFVDSESRNHWWEEPLRKEDLSGIAMEGRSWEQAILAILPLAGWSAYWVVHTALRLSIAVLQLQIFLGFNSVTTLHVKLENYPNACTKIEFEPKNLEKWNKTSPCHCII